MKLFRAHLRSPRRRPPRSSPGYALVLIIAMLAVMAVLASVIVPDLVRKTMRLHGENEKQRLDAIGRGLLKSIERTQSIPGASNWVTAVAREAGLSQKEVTHVYPSFPSDTNTARIYLIHPSFKPGTGANRLAYHQQPAGITQGSTNAPTLDTRVMVVSNTRRELSLPLGSGVPSAAAFTNIWEWYYNPVTRSPPAGWPASWNGKGDGLHVKRLDLADYFHVLTLKGLNYSVNDSYPFEAVSSQVTRQFLKGSLLEVYRKSGILYASHIVRKKAEFLLPNGPLFYYRLNETSGTVATNYGTIGAAANGTYTDGPVLGQAGPRPPTFSGYPTNNNAVEFDGNNDYMDTSQQLPTTISGFTLAGWIYPTKNMVSNGAFFGQKEAIMFESKNNNSIRINFKNGGFLDANYSHPNNEWHHVAATGDGTTTRIYIDGVMVESELESFTNYGNVASTDPFRIAGLISKNNGNDYNNIIADEVVFYDRALSDSEMLDLYNGTVPDYEEP